MTGKVSRNWKDAGQVSRRLNYEFTYTYDPLHPHRAAQIGDYEYTYDANGNTTEIKRIEEEEPEGGGGGEPWTSPTDDDTHGSAPYNFTDVDPDDHSIECDLKRYEWDEENRLTDAYTDGRHTIFAYDAGGERTVKFSENGETVYVDKMYQLQVNHDPVTITKHIFVGTTRIASKVGKEDAYAGSESNSIYYYHGDHLGSSNFVTDCDGEEYEHVEYTPYGESWIDEGRDTLDKINYLFTSKELDRETGLYYFGARYLDPRTSRWLSPDPIMDGVNWYGYVGNNPVKYIDPAGLYKVESGDTLWDIAQKYHTTIPKIMELNKGNIEKAAEIDVGQHIVLPGEVNAYKDVEDYHRVYANRENGGYPWPVAKGIITSAFAWRVKPKSNPPKKHFHNGIDIASVSGLKGEPILVIDDGKVIWTRTGQKEKNIDGGWGNYVMVKHPDGTVSIYAHMDTVSVKKGDTLKQGQKMGTMGTTGYSTGPHVHLEIHDVNGKPIDPFPLLGPMPIGISLHNSVGKKRNTIYNK